jgi:hypothetical protein
LPAKPSPHCLRNDLAIRASHAAARQTDGLSLR